MYGYGASRAAPPEHGYPGGHGAGHHDYHQQQQYSTQWGEHQQGHGNGHLGYSDYKAGVYGSPQGHGSHALPSQSYNQLPAHGNYDYAPHHQPQWHQYQQPYQAQRQQGTDHSNYRAGATASGSSGGQTWVQPSVHADVNQYSARTAYGSPAAAPHHNYHTSQATQSYLASSDTSRQSNGRRLPSKSPTLPALDTTSHTSGLDNLFQQFEVEIDQIQAKHTPISSPVSTTFANLTPQAIASSSSSRLGYVQGLPRRQDSDNTLRADTYPETDQNAYGGSGIISMYDPRVPSPVPSSTSISQSQDYHASTHGETAYSSGYTGGQLQGDQVQQQAAFGPGPSFSASTSASQRQPAWSTDERQRRPSGSNSRINSARGVRAEYSSNMQEILPHSAPSGPSVSLSNSVPVRARPSNSSLRSGRPSQDSNMSSTSSARSQFPSSPTIGIIAPRPSLSSSLASQPSLNFSETSQSRVRPLPIPQTDVQESEHLIQGTSYVSSPDIQESLPPIRERARSEFSRQSDFTKDFYAAGSAVPDALQQRQNSIRQGPPAARHPVADRYRNIPQAVEQNQPLAYRSQSRVPTTTPSMRSISGLSINSIQGTPPSQSASHFTQHPPIVHSQSDPLATHRPPSASSSQLRQGSNQALPLSATPSRTPKSSASRSASFSTSASRARPDHARRNVSMGHHASAVQIQGRPGNIAEPSPPLPSSPSISISTSFHDTSISSAYSALSTAPSVSTYTSAMQKQASMSPSNMSLSAQGFLSSRHRRDSERERHRMEGLGLQHLNPALLSNLAVAFKDRVPKTLNVKGSVHYPSSFTGEQAVSCLAEILPFPYTDDRRIAVMLARNLHRNMFFNEVDWDDAKQLRDSHERVYCFQDDEEQATMDYLNGNPAAAGVYSPASRALEQSQPQMREVPNGVITRFTKCYSPFCGMEGTASSGSCYSLYCPNGKHPLGLQRKQSSLSIAASTSTEEPSAPEAWASTAPPELLERLGPKEVARQNVIFEIVTGEQAYKKDLDMLELAYAEPLRSANPPIIEPARLATFANQVFANLDELRSQSARLINAFQIRQREQTPVVESIGDLILDAALEWGQAYMDFAEAQVMGEYLVQEEKNTNSAFATFLQSRREAFGIKQDFRHYHLRATIRLQRYLLPLAEYVKRCPDGHPDRETTQEAMRIIRQQCDACNAAVAAAQLRLACIQYDKLIERDFNYANDLDLLHPSRQLFHHGKMYAKPEGARSEWTEYQVMLFDHYLAIAKPRRTAEGYRLLRKPVRLEMLNVSGWDDPPTIRSSGFHLSNVIRTGERREASSSHNTSDRTESKMWPIAFRIHGRLSGTLTLFVETPKNDKDGQARRDWKAKVEQAAAARKAVLDAGQVFDLRRLMDPDLRKPSTATNVAASSMGKILASCPFTGPTGQRLVAVGTSTGLYIALKRDPTSLRQILQISTQYCAVLQDFGMFLVHTEGRLLSYLLETLVQTSSGEGRGQQGPQQVSGQKDILFFKVGRVGPRTLVVYAKKDGVSSTVLKAMEPVANAERSRVQHSRFLGMGGKKTEWFRLFKDAAVPTEVYNLTFTRSKLALVCAPGFEILDIDTLKTGSFPDWTSIKADPTKFDASMAILQRRCYESRAIGLFRISDSEFLFCYEDFAFFADRHGDPVRSRFRDLIEWEGRPDTVVYCAPYILAFDSRFIEIRDISRRGKLVQIIRGTNIRCTYDGQGLPSVDMEIRVGGSVNTDERLPHFVMRENNVDRLYELTPRLG